jgi:hypothetical protein
MVWHGRAAQSCVWTERARDTKLSTCVPSLLPPITSSSFFQSLLPSSSCTHAHTHLRCWRCCWWRQGVVAHVQVGRQPRRPQALAARHARERARCQRCVVCMLWCAVWGGGGASVGVHSSWHGTKSTSATRHTTGASSTRHHTYLSSRCRGCSPGAPGCGTGCWHPAARPWWLVGWCRGVLRRQSAAAPAPRSSGCAGMELSS